MISIFFERQGGGRSKISPLPRRRVYVAIFGEWGRVGVQLTVKNSFPCWQNFLQLMIYSDWMADLFNGKAFENMAQIFNFLFHSYMIQLMISGWTLLSICIIHLDILISNFDFSLTHEWTEWNFLCFFLFHFYFNSVWFFEHWHVGFESIIKTE